MKHWGGAYFWLCYAIFFLWFFFFFTQFFLYFIFVHKYYSFSLHIARARDMLLMLYWLWLNLNRWTRKEKSIWNEFCEDMNWTVFHVSMLARCIIRIVWAFLCVYIVNEIEPYRTLRITIIIIIYNCWIRFFFVFVLFGIF